MALEEEIFTILSGATSLLATTSAKVFPVKSPQNAVRPYMVYMRVTGGQLNGLDGYLNKENPRIQIDIYSSAYTEVKDIAVKVRTAMDGSTTFSAINLTDQDIFEDEVKSFRVSMDFSCWNDA